MDLKKPQVSKTGLLVILAIVIITVISAKYFFAQKQQSKSSIQVSAQLLSSFEQARNQNEKLALMTQTVKDYPNFFSVKGRTLLPFTISFSTSKAEGDLASEGECNEYLRLIQIGTIIYLGKEDDEHFVEAEIWMMEQATAAYENFLKNGCTRFL